MHLLFRDKIKWLWFDELFTQNLAQQATLANYWQGLASDGNPPLGSALAWLSMHIFGLSSLALRLPSLLAYLGATLLVYRIVGVRLGKITALLAAVLFNVNLNVTYYAIEARPYALVLFFTTAAFASWQAATDEEHPHPGARWLLAASLAGALLSHYYGIINAGLPVLCGEMARTLRRKRVDWKLALTASSALAILGFTIPLALRTQHILLQYSNYKRGVPHTFPDVDYKLLLDTPQSFLVYVILAAAICVGFSTWSGDRGLPHLRGLRRWPAHETVGLMGSAITLLVVYVICSMTSGYFSGARYGIGTYLGIVAITVTIYALLEKQTQLILALILLWPFAKDAFKTRSQARLLPPELVCLRTLPAGPIVIAQALGYLPDQHYADASLRPRLVYLTDRQYALGELYNIPELAMLAQEPVFTLGLQNYADFLKKHRDFWILDNGGKVQDYVVDHLKQDGYQFTSFTNSTCIGQNIYQVTAPSD